jgi:hypothetical protein
MYIFSACVFHLYSDNDFWKCYAMNNPNYYLYTKFIARTILKDILQKSYKVFILL